MNMHEAKSRLSELVRARLGKLKLAVAPARWFAILLEHHELRDVPLDAERAHDAVVLTSDERIRQYPGVVVRW